MIYYFYDISNWYNKGQFRVYTVRIKINVCMESVNCLQNDILISKLEIYKRIR